MPADCDVIVIFPIYGQFGAIWKPDSGRIVCKTYIFNNSNLLSYKNEPLKNPPRLGLNQTWKIQVHLHPNIPNQVGLSTLKEVPENRSVKWIPTENLVKMD